MCPSLSFFPSPRRSTTTQPFLPSLFSSNTGKSLPCTLAILNPDFMVPSRGEERSRCKLLFANLEEIGAGEGEGGGGDKDSRRGTSVCSKRRGWKRTEGGGVCAILCGDKSTDRVAVSTNAY